MVKSATIRLASGLNYFFLFFLFLVICSGRIRLRALLFYFGMDGTFSLFHTTKVIANMDCKLFFQDVLSTLGHTVQCCIPKAVAELCLPPSPFQHQGGGGRGGIFPGKACDSMSASSSLVLWMLISSPDEG